MESRPSGFGPQPPPWSPAVGLDDRVRAGLEVLLVTVGIEFLAAAGLSLALGPRDFAELGSAGLTAVVVVKNLLMPVALIALFLRLDRRGFRHLGFGRRRPAREIILGLALFPPILLLAGLLVAVLTGAFPELRTEEVNPLLVMVRDPGDVFFFAVMSVLGGGVGEETVRAFVLDRFERYLGGMAVGLVVWSTAFGLLHTIQGLDKAIAVAFLGLVLGLIYAWRRDPTASITAHATFDVAQTLLAYFATNAA